MTVSILKAFEAILKEVLTVPFFLVFSSFFKLQFQPSAHLTSTAEIGV